MHHRAGRIWLGWHFVGGGEVHLHLLRTKCRGYLPRYLVFPGLFLSHSILFCFPVLVSNNVSGLPGLSTSFLSGLRSGVLDKLSQTGNISPGGWRPLADRVCHGRVRGRGPVWPPLRSNYPTWSVCTSVPTFAQKAQVGCHSHGLQPNSPRVWGYSSQAWKGCISAGGLFSVHPSVLWGSNTSCDQAFEDQCGWHQTSLLLLCWGISRVTFNLSSGHMLFCVPGPYGHKIVLSLMSLYFFQCWCPPVTWQVGVSLWVLRPSLENTVLLSGYDKIVDP